MPYLLLIAHCHVCDLGLLQCLLIQNYNYSVFFFLGRLYCSLNKLMFISLVLFQFGCFALLVKVYISLYQKYFSCPTISYVLLCKTSVVCPKHAFMPCWIAVEYVVRVQHFSASSLLITCSMLITVIRETSMVEKS